MRLDGLRYHYLDEGAGDPLLLVHGNPTWTFYWRNLISAWRPRHRVVAVDHIGCGLSDKPADYPYTIAQHSRNLGQLIETLDLKRITLVVHDWGGPIGLRTALAMPERFARLVILNTGAFPPPRFPKRIRLCRTPLLGPLAVRGLNIFSRAAFWMAAAKPDRLTPAVRAGMLAPYDSWANRVAVQRFIDIIPASASDPMWKELSDLETGLKRLADHPVQLIWGMQDWCFGPECLRRFQTIFPNAEVHELHDASHYVVEDAHERIAPLVEEFIERHPVSPSTDIVARTS